MLVLLAVAFVAGAGTAFSPCALPVLPALLSASGTGGRRRPIGIAVGLALTFTIVVAGIASLLGAVGLGAGALRILAIVLLAGFGLTLLVPRLGDLVERPLARLSRFGPKSRGEGFWSGIAIGGALGFVYLPCAGPILAAVIGVSATQGTSAATLLMALSYAVGSALVLLLIGLLGRRGIQALGGSRFGARVKAGLGAILVATAVAVAFQLDTGFQALIADRLPAFVVNPTGALERSAAVEERLAEIRGSSRFEPAATPMAPAAPLPVLGEAPELSGIEAWLNGPPRALAEMRGEVTLIDFWTYSCINCIRTLPQLTAWDRAYRDEGLNVIGIHTPEFEFERERANVAAAIEQNRIEYPVALDNEYATWDAFGNKFWPAKYLIDARGRVRYAHFGEGAYAETEAAIRTLLEEAGAKQLPPPAGVDVERASAGTRTPETYFGLLRRQGFVPDDRRAGPVERDPVAVAELEPGRFTLGGVWRFGSEAAAAGPGAHVAGRVQARRVFMVLAPPDDGTGTVRVSIDGEPIAAADAGADLTDGIARIDGQRLYRLVDRDSAAEFVLDVELSPGTRAYTFTFG